MTKIKKPELLAPAGGIEQLRSAIHFGADAVYCASDRFGLRQRADNFNLEDIPVVVNEAHAAGVKLFITCNIYMHRNDLSVLPGYLESLAEAGVDGLIVSDLGAFRMARRYAPEIDLHISTQASCSNTEAALAWHELGAKRIVCAREMSLEDIASMRSELPDTLELEVFVHGAMCMAISGRCLISDHLTGRSANRGHCVQPCRWGYSLEDPTRPGQSFPIEEDGGLSYIMNSKDLCMLEHLDDLIDAGIDSIKIEGRNKKAFYVATVVNAYRQVLNGAPASEYLSELETVSHRPYSTGFFFGAAEQSGNASGYTQEYDWVAEVAEPDGGDCRSEEAQRTKVICRNRFYEGDELEVLSPDSKTGKLRVSKLRLEYPNGGSEVVECANRAMDLYSFETDRELKPHDILRVKRINSQHKN